MAGDEGQQIAVNGAAAEAAPEPSNAAGEAPAIALPAWLRRPVTKLEPFRELIQQACKLMRLPFWLVCAQIAQESDFDAQAKSACGAIGLMQILPATARFCGIDPEKLWTPEANIRLGCRILAEGRDVFRKETEEERLKFALAAYNGGLGPVINAQALAFRHGFDSAYWQNVRLMLPEAWIYVDGEWKKPDSKQIINYVDRIWQRYQLWKGQGDTSEP